VDTLAALPPADDVGARMLPAAVAAHEMAGRDPAGAARARAALADGTLVGVVNGQGALGCGWLTLIAARPAGTVQPGRRGGTGTATDRYGRCPRRIPSGRWVRLRAARLALDEADACGAGLLAGWG
jgi:hypothetical protein